MGTVSDNVKSSLWLLTSAPSRPDNLTSPSLAMRVDLKCLRLIRSAGLAYQTTRELVSRDHFDQLVLTGLRVYPLDHWLTNSDVRHQGVCEAKLKGCKVYGVTSTAFDKHFKKYRQDEAHGLVRVMGLPYKEPAMQLGYRCFLENIDSNTAEAYSTAITYADLIKTLEQWANI